MKVQREQVEVCICTDLVAGELWCLTGL